VEAVYDSTNFQDLTDRYRAILRAKAPTYSI
jgi:hypothetical protein